MKRPIKFRGVDKAGKLHYGFFYVDFCGLPCIAEGRGGKLIPVDENSIAQLVGYDSAGNEVYEGDKILIDDAGEDEFFATCLPVGVNHWGGCFLHGGNFIFTKEFSLKEACQNPWNALQEIDNLIERHCEEAKQ